MPLSTGHACPALVDLVSWVEAQDKLAPGGWDGRGAAGPADKVYVSALHPGWQEPGKQTQPSLSLPFFGCFSNLHDSFSPRLIAQSQAARTTGHEPSCPTAMGIYPFYSLLRPLFALVWKGLDHPAGGSENMHCEGTGTGDSVKASVLRALPCSRGHREPAWDKKSGSKEETAHPRAA